MGSIILLTPIMPEMTYEWCCQDSDGGYSLRQDSGQLLPAALQDEIRQRLDREHFQPTSYRDILTKAQFFERSDIGDFR